MVLRSPPSVLFVCLVAFLSVNCGDNATPVPINGTNNTVLCAQAACATNATCEVANGAAKCVCPAGTDDIGGSGKMCLDHNECTDTPAPCAVNAVCANQPGSFTCVCKAGFSGDGKTCADVNECSTANGGCGANATCTNAAGGRTCACKSGFIGDGVTCTDIDECQTANGACDPNATCGNSSGGRTCTCKAGYAGDGVTCADVDECASANGGCAADALCSNTGGGRVCTCKSGFSGNGTACADIDECGTNNGGCDPLAVCNNMPGAFTCGNCPVGFTGGGAGGCVEVNECTAGTANCSAQGDCTNTTGSFTCACKPGFTGNGVTCSTCRACSLGQYETAACTRTTDAVCSACPVGCANCTSASTCTSCAPGRFLMGGACVACATCGVGEYQTAACTATQNTVCSTCSTCPVGQHQTAACGGSSNTACGACATCGVAQYQINACTSTSNATCGSCDTECVACTGPGSCTTCAPGHYLIGGVCVACTACLPGEFQAAACTATQNTACTICATCGAGQFPSASCTATVDTVCSSCSTCGAGTYQTAACGSSNTVCGACATCGAGQFESNACAPTTNRGCSACTTCGAGFFQAAACMATTNAACSACTACGAGTYETAACGGSSNATCATCATCPTGQFVTAACMATANTTCGACDAHCDACTGPAACTACASGYALASGVCTATTVSTSCRALLAASPGTPDGVYLLDPDQGSGANAFLAYCDMTTDGGGWTKILQYANDAYTPSAAAIGDIAVAGTPDAAKLSDANINALGALGPFMEYRFQGATSTKRLYMKVSDPWDDLARSHGLMLNGTALACEDTTTCTYVAVTGRPAIDSNDWSPSSIGGANNEDRYFTDYNAWPQCFETGSTTTRCYGSGVTTGHVLIPNFSIWVREAPPMAIIYKLDENSGTTVADTGGGNQGATVVSGSWTPGHTGSAFAGGFRTDAVVPVSTDVTISLWVRRDGPGSGFSRILSFHDDLELADWASQDEIAFHTLSTSWRTTGISFGSGFHHVAITVGGGTVTVYFDGLSIHSTPGTVNLGYQMSVGTRWNDVESWNGPIDQVRVYDRVLGAAEILSLSLE